MTRVCLCLCDGHMDRWQQSQDGKLPSGSKPCSLSSSWHCLVKSVKGQAEVERPESFPGRSNFWWDGLRERHPQGNSSDEDLECSPAPNGWLYKWTSASVCGPKLSLLALMFFAYNNKTCANKQDIQDHEEGAQSHKLWHILVTGYSVVINGQALAYLMMQKNTRCDIEWNWRSQNSTCSTIACIWTCTHTEGDWVYRR